jgi:hypothetical protein
LCAGGKTICGEYEDGKHFVPVDKAHIRWFGLLPNLNWTVWFFICVREERGREERGRSERG